MRRRLLPLVLVVLAAAACSGDDGGPPATTTTEVPTTTTEPGPTPSDEAAALCAAEPVRVPRVRVADPELVELSGLADTPEGLWAHNDSGDTARAFLLAPDGTTQQVLELPGVEAVDWEDMAARGDELFFADIGDNEGVREEVLVYRVTPSDPAAAQTITLHYPDGPRDAEALLVDPVTGDLVIVQKRFGGRVGVYSAPESEWSTGDATLEKVGTIVPGSTPLHAVTAGDVGLGGDVVGLRTYAGIQVWPREEGQSVAEALVENQPCDAPFAIERQGEALTFTDDGYVTASEGEHPVLHRFRAVASG